MSKKLLLLFLLITFSTFGQSPNDCTNAISICGDSSLSIDPDGIGFDEFSLPGNFTPPCYTFDSNTIWFKFEIVQSGTFTFDLIPDNGEDDYDFAIYGPNVTCTTLGNSIRCSSTNPQAAGVPAATGLNLTATDFEEGPGEDGDGYLEFIDATAGDIYYLLVDRAVGSGPLSLFYTGEATLPNPVFANQAPNLMSCDVDGTQDGFTPFNLETQNSTIIGVQTDVVVTYHSSLNDATIGDNALVSPYTNIANPQPIYARTENLSGCIAITSFTIEVGSIQLTNPDDVAICTYNTTENFDLNSVIPDIIANTQGYVILYFLDENDANNNVNNIPAIITLTETPTTIYVRIQDEDEANCYGLASFDAYVNMITQATQPENILGCDDDLDGEIIVNLNQKTVEVLQGLSASDFRVLYYLSEEDRLNETNAVNGNLIVSSSPQIVYISMVENATGCFDYTQFSVSINPPALPVFDQAKYYYCLNLDNPVTISVQTGFENYIWSNGEQGATLNSINVNAPGNYTVTVTNSFGCEGIASVEVLPSNTATILDIKTIDFSGNNNQIEIFVEGQGMYEYALNVNGPYQESPIFNGLGNGYFTVYVRDKNGCGIATQEVLILDYPLYFTPNSDGYHDTWKIIGIENYPGTKIKIFDRFGKLLKQISPSSIGWDGSNLEGKVLASNDYWFTIDIPDRPQYRGHFSLKR